MRRFRIRIALLVAAMSLVPLVAWAATYPQVRDGWFVGLGVGGGTAALTADGETTDREGGAGGSFRVGYVFSPKVGFGLETNGWFKSQDNVDFRLSTATACVSFYPAEGLVLRAGLGGASAEAQVDSGSTSVTATESGFGFTIGAAYEFRVTRTFALGPQLDYALVNLDSFDANYINLGLSLNWYFIPK